MSNDSARHNTPNGATTRARVHTVGKDDPRADLTQFCGTKTPLDLSHTFDRGGWAYMAVTDGVRVAALRFGTPGRRLVPLLAEYDLGPLMARALGACPDRIGTLALDKLQGARAVLGPDHETTLHMFPDGSHELEVKPSDGLAFTRRLPLKAVYVHAFISVNLKHLFDLLGFIGGKADLYLGEHAAEDAHGDVHRALVLVPFGDDIEAPARVAMLMPVVPD